MWIGFSQMFQKVNKSNFELYFEYIGKQLTLEIKGNFYLKKENSNQVCGYEAINFVKKLYEIFGKKYISNRIKAIDNSILVLIDKN